MRTEPGAGDRELPRWAVAIAPILAAALSSADVLFLLSRPERGEGPTTAILAATASLGLLASLATLRVLLRLRREIDRRAAAERGLRLAVGDLRGALDRERLLRRELDHRVRNNLASLLGLVGMYEGSSGPADGLSRSLRGRLIALAESYTLLTESGSGEIDIRELIGAIAAAVAPERRGAVSIAGPAVRLSGREGSAMALIVQELLANSEKHGALRRTGGSIAVAWRSEGPRLSLSWRERWDGPDLSGNGAGGGFGLELVRGFARSDLRGDVELSSGPGLWSVDLVAELDSLGGSRTARMEAPAC